jgi:ABC-type Co2+ transport system permease subunit
MCASVWPLLVLHDRPDPLRGSIWTDIAGEAHSAVLAMIVATALAVAAYYRLKRLPHASSAKKYTVGACIGLVPAAFYLFTAPLWTSPAPMFTLLIGGALAGLVFGGPSFILLFRKAPW